MEAWPRLFREMSVPELAIISSFWIFFDVLNWMLKGIWINYFEKIRVFKAGVFA